jgi:hypothetical protein
MFRIALGMPSVAVFLAFFKGEEYTTQRKREELWLISHVFWVLPAQGGAYFKR